LGEPVKFSPLRPAYLGFGILILLGVLLAAGGSNSRLECVNGFCLVDVKSSLIATLLAPIALLVIFLAPKQASFDNDIRPVRRRTRVAAFLLDVVVITLLTGPIASMELALEAVHTGIWSWEFQRTFTRPSDILSSLAFFAIFGFWAVYFHRSIRNGTPTIGQYVMGFRVIPARPDERETRPILHLFCAAYGASAWPVTLLLRDKDGDRSFWWNGLANTRAIHVTYQ